MFWTEAQGVEQAELQAQANDVQVPAAQHQPVQASQAGSGPSQQQQPQQSPPADPPAAPLPGGQPPPQGSPPVRLAQRLQLPPGGRVNGTGHPFWRALSAALAGSWRGADAAAGGDAAEADLLAALEVFDSGTIEDTVASVPASVVAGVAP